MINGFQKQLRYFLGGILCVAGVSFVVAWSSKSFPPCEPIHQIAIQTVLSNQISAGLIKILQDQQTVVDQDQQATNSFEHSMTGIAGATENVKTNTPVYLNESEEFIHTNLVAAIQARQAGDTTNAFVSLGKALHPLEDATSPAHEPFQAWNYNEGLWAEIKHVSMEYSYPDSQSDTNQVAERAELEGSVQYAYDIFLGKVEMPAQFYNHTNGLLELPPAYLHPGTK
jgi:hypothetical protein